MVGALEAALPVIVLGLLALGVTSFIGHRLRIPPPVLLVVAGALVTWLPNIPQLALDPALILLFFLPPLLYADAFETSWLDFRRWLRPIVQLAVLLVAITVLVVGVVTKLLIPELPWAVCFVLGAVISPTDTVAAQSVLARLRLPRRIHAIVGGESLVNDATGLVAVQIGVAVVMTGVFETGAVFGEFAKVAGLGLLIGVIVGVIFSFANNRLRGTPGLFVLSLLAPYIAMFVAHVLGASGVLAVVVAGFVVSWNIHQLAADTRRDLLITWNLLTYVLNGISFFLIGYAAMPWLLRADPTHGFTTAALTIGVTVIAVRIGWVFVGAYLPLLANRRWREQEGGLPSWRSVLVVGWCGMRGVVSLAAALALPLLLPGRDVVIGVTLVVIAMTLLIQGLTLQPLVSMLGLPVDGDSALELRHGRERLLVVGIERLDAFCTEHACPVAVHHLRAAMADQLLVLRDQDAAERHLAAQRVEVSEAVRQAIIQAQENELLRLRDRHEINDRTALELQLELDHRTSG